MKNQKFNIASLREAYLNGRAKPARMVGEILRRVKAGPPIIWNSVFSRKDLENRARELAGESPEKLPLYGIPFAVKDNIDVEGLPTTAGCPGFAYMPKRSAPAVDALLKAGAIVVGKTHMDQFATGLVGARSPDGPCPNAFDPEYISGGSSSGSAAAIAAGQVSFALGTDTAGSGRIPAAFNNLIGLKPSKGLLSTRGVVPACRALDCVSIFALTPGDAMRVLDVAGVYDAKDPFARNVLATAGASETSFTFGVPREEQLDLDGPSRPLWKKAIKNLEKLGGRARVIDFKPFREAAELLYEGPYVAERYAAVGRFIEKNPDHVLPVIREIILGGREAGAADAFRASYRLAELKRRADKLRAGMDFIMTPSAPTIYKIEQVEKDPLGPNRRLGFYTNFMNLLDFSAAAVPAGFRRDGLPFGVTIFTGAGGDEYLLRMAHRMSGGQEAFPALPARNESDFLPIVVCGAHMSGMALNHELTGRGARLREKTRTAPVYRFFALPGKGVARPGLVRIGKAEGGASIDVEVWDMPAHRWGDFIAGIPAPLCIGGVHLENGPIVKGFLCEARAVDSTPGVRDITELGSWREFLKRGR